MKATPRNFFLEQAKRSRQTLEACALNFAAIELNLADSVIVPPLGGGLLTWDERQKARQSYFERAIECMDIALELAGQRVPLVLEPPEVAEGGVLVRQVCIAGCEEPAPAQVHMLETEKP